MIVGIIYCLLCIIFYLQHNHLIPKFVVIIISNHCWSLRVCGGEFLATFQCYFQEMSKEMRESMRDGERKVFTLYWKMGKLSSHHLSKGIQNKTTVNTNTHRTLLDTKKIQNLTYFQFIPRTVRKQT